MTKGYLAKGSDWRKWDLQIHVPGAKHADQYTAEDGDDAWTRFIDYIQNSDVSVFGITDYFSVEGYETFLNRTEEISKLKKKTFFPCIEFRLDLSVNKNSEQLQCHLIFDNEYEISRIKEFLTRLPLSNKKSNGASAYCTDEDITHCGGYDKVSITKEALEESLRNSFGDEKRFLIVGVASGMGSNRADSNSNIKKELADSFDELCDLFFGHQNNRDYFLREDRYENKERRAKRKPVVATSDCHTLEDCEKKLGGKFIVEGQNGGKLERYGFSWIKADTTFDGLKQILFEPVDRTVFGYDKPESKRPYYLIDKIRFIDSSGQDNFPPETIEVNHNLATIIGGKSTGKSLLLYYVAKTISDKEVNSRSKDRSSATLYNFHDSDDFDFEVVWTDGDRTYLKKVEGSDDTGERKILYIPQNYLNELSEKNARSRKALNKFVRSVLLQDESIQRKYSESLAEMEELSKSISVGVANLYQIEDETRKAEDVIKQIGDEEGIKKYISQLKEEADEIKSKSGLTEQEIRDYESFSGRAKDTTTSISVLLRDKNNLFAFKKNISKQLGSLEELRDEQVSYLGNEEIKDEFKKEFSKLSQIKTELLNSIDKITGSIDVKIEDYKEKLEGIEKDLTYFMGKVELQKELRRKSEAIKDEQSKLDKTSLEKKNLKSKKGSYEKEKNSLIKIYKDIFDIYDDLSREFKKYEEKFEDISLSVLVDFDEEKFNEEVIDGFLNKPDIKRNIDGVDWKSEYYYQFNSSKHMDFVKGVFNGVVDGKIKTTKNQLPKDAVVKILKNYFDLQFQIIYKNDSLDKMSPGKKGFVLLRLLIDLSNEEWPILLDQPEDDLDNRSVYEDLVSFVKRKKKQRQIIIVTHNPNLVVAADAEQIIVANQEGQEKGRDNKKYKFEYVSGALEHSFELPETSQEAILFRKGIRQHVCEVLEGGKEAFQKRERRYSFSS